jgi:hypothetical protein
MSDWDEEPFTPTDEIEDPIFPDEDEEMNYQSEEVTRPPEENLLRALKEGICQDALKKRFPTFSDWELVKRTLDAETENLLSLARCWIQALKKDCKQRNQGAILTTKFLKAFPSLARCIIPEGVEEDAIQLKIWRRN